jgi:hypothetical protein
MMPNDHKTQTWLSPFVAVAFFLTAGTGLFLLFHLKNPAITVLHEWMGFLFTLAGALHLMKNWRVFKSYFKLRIALIAAAVALILGALLFASHLGENHGQHHGPPSHADSSAAPEH